MAVSQISGTFDYRLVSKNLCNKVFNTLDECSETYHTRNYDRKQFEFIRNYQPTINELALTQNTNTIITYASVIHHTNYVYLSLGVYLLYAVI